MEGSLRALMDAEAPRLLPPQTALAVLGALSDQLFPGHAAGRSHGPFGPSTITIAGDTVTLSEAAPEPAYVAPELREGGDHSPASDAYSFATLAHELLAGNLPTLGADGSAAPIIDSHPGFPAFAGEAIARGLQTDPAARPLPKVLFTLLRVVPVDRWPASSQPEPEPAPEPAPEPEPVVEEVAQRPSRDLQHPAPDAPGALERHEWHAAFAPVQDVPAIEWQADQDPTRPSDEVPAIEWSAGDDEQEKAQPDSLEQPTGRAFAQTDDATFLHHFMNELRAPADVPLIEPLDDSIPAGQLEHRPGRRVRRKRRERSPDRMQKIVLLLILMVLIAVGAVWALTHKDGPKYDPKLQGASLSVAHPAPVRV